MLKRTCIGTHALASQFYRACQVVFYEPTCPPTGHLGQEEHVWIAPKVIQEVCTLGTTAIDHEMAEDDDLTPTCIPCTKVEWL